MSSVGAGNMRLPRTWNDRTGRSALRTVAAWVRSQSGLGGSLALTTCPTLALTKIPPHLFRMVLLRRVRLPLLPSSHTVACLATTALRAPRVLGRRGFAFGSAAARV